MKKVLFIIDAQNDFCHPDGTLYCENGADAVNNICKLLEQEHFDAIISSFDTHDDNYYLESMEGKHLPIKHCIENTWGGYLHKDIYDAIYPHELHSWRVNKNTFMMNESEVDAIFETEPNLNGYLYKGEIYICGFATDICVLNNALMLKHRFNDSYEINLIENCCAGTTKEMHDKAVETMKVNNVNIV